VKLFFITNEENLSIVSGACLNTQWMERPFFRTNRCIPKITSHWTITKINIPNKYFLAGITRNELILILKKI